MTQPQSLRDFLVSGRFKATPLAPAAAPIVLHDSRYHVLLVHWTPASRREPAADLAGTACDISETTWRPGGQLTLPARALDLLILDFPTDSPIDSSAYTTIKRLLPELPLIVMASGDSHVDRVVALELGADDFVSKPVHPRELGARVRAVLKRRFNATVSTGRAIRFGDIQLDLVDRVATTPQGTMKLCNVEFHVLRTLIEAGGRPVSREILARCPETDGGEDERDLRTVDVIVSRMRRKLDTPGWESRIRTIRGFGYKL
jgi:DNA-binding response OmpR family regulator